MNKLLTILFMNLLLTGCASTSTNTVKPIEVSTCCMLYNQMEFLEWIGSESKVKIDEKSLAFKFEDGVSYFKAVKLPLNFKVNSILVMRSHTSAFLRSASHFILPSATFLDLNKQKIVTRTDNKLTIDTYGLLGEYTLLTSVSVPEDAKYVVLHTPQEVVGKKFIAAANANNSFISGGVNYYVFGKLDYSWNLGATGSVTISLK